MTTDSLLDTTRILANIAICFACLAIVASVGAAMFFPGDLCVVQASGMVL